MSSPPASKRDRRLAARAERQRLAEEGRRKARQRRRLGLGALILLGVAVLVGGGLMLSQKVMQPSPGRSLPDEGRDHVTQGAPLQYRSNPPASGPHYASWTRSGVYTEPQSPGNWVHSLEHGYVVVLYNCPTPCPELVQQLRQFYEAAPKSSKYGYQKLVITPYEDMDSRIAALAWNRIEEMDQFDWDRLMAFYRAYVDRGPEDAG